MKPRTALTELDSQCVANVSGLTGARSLPAEEWAAAAKQRQGRDRIHVMYFIDWLYIQGGGEEALLRMVQNLSRDRFRLSVVTMDANPDAARTVRNSGSDLYVFPIRRTYGWSGLKTASKLRRLIRSNGVDIVHTFFETANTWGGLITKLSRRPLLVSSRRDMNILRLTKHHLAYKVINRWADAFVTVSDSVRDFCIEAEALDPTRVFTIHNGVDIAKIDSANGVDALKARLNLGEGAPVLTTVANIRRVKGLDILLRAAAIVHREYPNLRVLIAGNWLEPAHYEELCILVRDLGLTGNVNFLGHFEQVFTLLKLSNVFCLLSRSEGFSNALLEAMAANLPCVVTNVGGNPEAIVDGENGFLLPPEDPQAAARRIVMLLQNAEVARRVGMAARKTVEERFTIQRSAAQMGLLYDKLMDSTSRVV